MEAVTKDQTEDGTFQALVTIAAESWRFGKVFERIVTKLDAGEQNRYRNQFRWFSKKVDESLATAGLQIVNIEGQRFDPGVAATPLNIGEFDTGDELVVDQMIEPIVVSGHGLVRMGTVTLKKVTP